MTTPLCLPALVPTTRLRSAFLSAQAPSWQAATAYVEKGAGGSGAPAPEWHPEVLPGQPYTDKGSGVTSVVPGSGKFDALGRDPYRDLVLSLARATPRPHDLA